MASDLIETRLSEISERIRKGRESQHLTLAELGQRSGVAPSTIQKIENRQMIPSILVILNLRGSRFIASAWATLFTVVRRSSIE
jgi:transcriptional regulator with XRE-family HTH domain